MTNTTLAARPARWARLRRAVLAATVLASATAAQSAIVPALHAINWKAANDHLLTRDVVSGLDWLDITQTRGYGGSAFAGTTGVGGIFEGFRMATTAEFNALLVRAGVIAAPMPAWSGTTRTDAVSIENARTLLGLVGMSSDWPGVQEAYAYLDGSHVAASGTTFAYAGYLNVIEFDPSTGAEVNAGTTGTFPGSSGIGRWLVRSSSSSPHIPDTPPGTGTPVSTPGTLPLLLLAGVLAVALPRRRTG